MLNLIHFRFNKCLTFAIFFLFFQNSYADWKVVDAGINENLLSVSSYSQYGLIVGEKNLYIATAGTQTGSNWSLYNPSGTNALLFKQCKFYSSSNIYSNALVYICGEDTINHQAVIFSISLTNNTLSLEYTGPTGSRLNSIVYNYTILHAVGDNGLIIQQNTTLDINAVDNLFHVLQSNTTKNLHYISANTSSYYIAGDEILISGSILYGTILKKDYPGLKFTSITLSSYGPYLLAITPTNIYDVDITLTCTIDTLYDAPGLRPTSIYRSEYGLYLSSKSGIYFRKSNTNYFEYQPSSLKWNLTYLKFEDSYNAFGVGPNGLIVYNTDNGGLTKPYARISILGGCTNDYITYSSEPGGANNISWYANGTYQSSSPTWFARFTLPGQYDIRYISSNNLYADTVYQTVYITNKPAINLITSVSDNILCKSEQTVITISDALQDYTYQLLKPSDNTIYGTVHNTGTTAVMLTGYINKTGNYYIRSIHDQSGCVADFTNTIPIQVEHTKARFTSSEINVSSNTPITLTNNSFESTTAKWEITNGSNTIHSTVFSPQVSFAIPGSTLVKLVATSQNNCSDSVTAPSTFVIEEPANDACWLLHFDTLAKLNPEAVVTDIKECADGFLVTGQYFKQNFPTKAGSPLKSHPFGGGYLAKYSPAGILKWVSYTVDSSNYNQYMYRPVTFISSAVAPNGNIYVIGYVNYNSYLFDSSGDSIKCASNITASGGDVGIITCYSPDGRILWIKHSDHILNSIITDNDGSLIMTGTYSDSDMIGRTFRLATSTSVTTLPYIDNSLFVNNLLSDGDGQFILKLDPSGNFLWYNLLTDILDMNTPLSVDSQNNIFFTSTCAMQRNLGLLSVNSTQVKKVKPLPSTNGGLYNGFGFAVKYSADGEVSWVTTMQDVVYSSGAAFINAAILNDDLYITGEASYNLNYRVLNPDNSFADIHTSSSFIIKLNNNGFYEWVSTTEDPVNGFYIGNGVRFFRATASHDSITVLAYIQSNSDGNFVSASGTKIPYSLNSAFAFINYDHSGNVLSYQTSGVNNSAYNILNSDIDFFYSNKNNSIYLSANLQINPPYEFYNESFDKKLNHFVYKISNNNCGMPSSYPPIATGIINNANQATSGLNVYPNPVNETSVVAIGEEGTVKTIRIFDITGKTIAATQTDNASYPLHGLLAQSIPGIYIVQVSYDDKIFTSRIMKME